jgi:STAM-binding protein
VHIASDLFAVFSEAAAVNTQYNIETCGILCGSSPSLIDCVLLPPQTGSSDQCECTDEELVLQITLQKGLIPLGWIHTHPQHGCFLSAIDLHTSAAYQCLSPDALAIVIAPTDTALPVGIFQLSPSGMTRILNCPLRGFHPHDDPPPLYAQSRSVRLLSQKTTLIDARDGRYK